MAVASHANLNPVIPAWLGTRVAAFAMLARSWRRWAPPPRMTTREWADRFMYLSSDSGSARPGKYSSELTPWLQEIQDAVDDPAVHKIVCMKSSQVGWTVGVVLAYICRRIDQDPCPIVVMFPTDSAGKEFNQEKFVPTVDVTPVLREKVDVSTSRRSGNRAHFKKFMGGFLKFVGSNSPRSVKSSSAPVLVVEEPDDANRDVKGQGDSIRLLEDRAKTHERSKVIVGGTPTLKDLSAVERDYLNSDQRKLFVPCHDCGEEHVLDWANVHWDEDPDHGHEVYGHALPETAWYTCPHCGSVWNDSEKNRNVRRARWRATAPFTGVAGFGYISELYVGWRNSRLENLVRKYLVAKHKESQGDISEILAFWNSTLGLPYEFGGGNLNAEELAACGEDYPELTIPRGGLVVTVGIDVQHDRFAVIIRAWGRGEESWLSYWGELWGTVTDSTDPVWTELERLVFGPLRHASGREVFARAVSIDSSDGNTSDLVYGWVRRMQRKYPRVTIMAVKGASESGTEREIFSLPKRVDHRTLTKASRLGLQVFLVGTGRAKDLILGSNSNAGRIRLAGTGPGRFHVYRDVRADYWEQLTNEVKAPSRRHRGKLIWQQKAGKPVEALDCEVYALHAARAVKVHIMSDAQWTHLEQRLSHKDLFAASTDVATEAQPPTPEAPTASEPADRTDATATQNAPPPAPEPAPQERPPRRQKRRQSSTGFGSDDWVL